MQSEFNGHFHFPFSTKKKVATFSSYFCVKDCVEVHYYYTLTHVKMESIICCYIYQANVNFSDLNINFLLIYHLSSVSLFIGFKLSICFFVSDVGEAV